MIQRDIKEIHCWQLLWFTTHFEEHLHTVTTFSYPGEASDQQISIFIFTLVFYFHTAFSLSLKYINIQSIQFIKTTQRKAKMRTGALYKQNEWQRFIKKMLDVLGHIIIECHYPRLHLRYEVKFDVYICNTRKTKVIYDFRLTLYIFLLVSLGMF